jgi:alkylmercury lyase
MAKTNQEKMNGKVQQAIDKIAMDVLESLIPEREQRRIFGQTLQLLANGCPVPPDEVAIRLQVPTDKVISTLRSFGAEFDKNGNIVGMWLSLVPTQHVYKVDGRKMYAWCAVDALLFPVMLKHTTAHIESPDPVTGDRIRVTVTPDRVEKVEPESAVVSWVNKADVTNIRGSVCHHVHFFSSPKTAAKWVAEHPGHTFYPVSDIYQATKHIILSKYSDMTVQQERRMCCC